MKIKQKPRSSFKDSRALGALTALLVIVGAVAFYVWPAVSRLTSGGTENAATLAADLARTRSALSLRESEQAELSAAAGSSVPTQLIIALPESADIPGLIKFLSYAARSAHADLTALHVALRPGEANSTSHATIVDISLALGDISYDQLKIFLNLLEKNLRLIDISQLAYNPDARTLAIRAASYAWNPAAAVSGARFNGAVFSSEAFNELVSPPAFAPPSAPTPRANPFATSTFP